MKLNSTVIVIVLIIAAFVFGYIVSEMFANVQPDQINNP